MSHAAGVALGGGGRWHALREPHALTLANNTPPCSRADSGPFFNPLDFTDDCGGAPDYGLMAIRSISDWLNRIGFDHSRPMARHFLLPTA